MITQFTTTHCTIAPSAIFAGRPAVSPCATPVIPRVLCDVAIAGIPAEKSARPAMTFADYPVTGQLRLETDAVTIPAATPELTTNVANFWKQLDGGSAPPAPEPLLLT